MKINQGKPLGCFGSGCLFISLNAVWLILLAIGSYYGYNSFRLVSSGVETDSVIVAIESNYSDGSTTYSPVYEYSYNGETYRYTSVNSSSFLTNKVGDHVTLVVDPNDPENARVKSFYELWLLPAIMLPISLCLAVTMVLVSVFTFRQRRAANAG